MFYGAARGFNCGAKETVNSALNVTVEIRCLRICCTRIYGLLMLRCQKLVSALITGKRALQAAYSFETFNSTSLQAAIHDNMRRDNGLHFDMRRSNKNRNVRDLWCYISQCT